MSIHNGINLKLPSGKRGHYIRAKTYNDGAIKTAYFSVAEHGEKKALKLAKAWLESKTTGGS